jgi:hypothetical protein
VNSRRIGIGLRHFLEPDVFIPLNGREEFGLEGRVG